VNCHHSWKNISIVRGEFIFHMGEEADRLYFLDKGTIKISVMSPEGEERILDILRAGNTFGDYSSARPRAGGLARPKSFRM
jgi:CRP-like cAMP-binding protein